MHKKMKRLAYSMLSGALILSNANIVYAGWSQQDNNWYYVNDETGQLDTGWKLVNNKWYHLDASGKMSTGWVNVNNNWYYLDPSGAMLTGWVLDGDNWFLTNDDGVMLVGKQTKGDRVYYLNTNANDGIYGSMKTGWVNIPDDKNAEAWYYFRPGSGEMVVGDQIIDGKTYNFAPTGLWLNNVWYQNKFYTKQTIKDAYNKDGSEKKNSEAVNKSVERVTYMNKNKNKKKKGEEITKPTSEYKKEVKKALNALPDGFIELYFSKAGGSITSYFENESMATVKYKVYDDDYDADDEDYKDNYTTESYDSKYKLSGNKIEFCGEGTNLLKAFGRFTDEYMKKNDSDYRKIKPSETDEFTDIYNEEIDSLESDIEDVEDLSIDDSDVRETQQAYFDTCYALYIVNNEYFKESCPRSYQYIDYIYSKCLSLLQK